MSKDKPGVVTIILDKTKKNILLVKRRDIPIWVLPGGGKEKGESFAKAAKREAEEETGLKIKIETLVGKYASEQGKEARKTILFKGKVIGGKPTLGQESQEIKFWPINKLPVTLPYYQKIWIKGGLKSTGKLIVRLQKLNIWKIVKQYKSYPNLFPHFIIFWLKRKVKWKS